MRDIAAAPLMFAGLGSSVSMGVTLGGRLTSAALAVPGVQGLLGKRIDKDHRDNLYWDRIARDQVQTSAARPAWRSAM